MPPVQTFPLQVVGVIESHEGSTDRAIKFTNGILADQEIMPIYVLLEFVPGQYTPTMRLTISAVESHVIPLPAGIWTGASLLGVMLLLKRTKSLMIMTRNAAVSAVFTLPSFAAELQAASVVFQHTGNTDPTTEGWFLAEGPGLPSVGPITNDNGLGIDAWFVDDNSPHGSTGWYEAVPTASQIAAGNLFGWRLSTRIRMPDDSTTFAGSPGLFYRDGTTSWQLHFGSESDGDPVVRLFNPGGPLSTFTLQGSGGGYHLYELVYDPIAASADFFVDGVEVISDYPGFGNSQTSVGWGVFSSGDVGQGNYNSVQWAIVPMPSSLALGVFSTVVFATLGFARHLMKPATIT